MEKGAFISKCGNYRYALHRIWDFNKKPLVFIMLNPSKADAYEDDNTILKIVKIAKYNGYGGIRVYNLFALRATNPKKLETHTDPFGRNAEWLSDIPLGVNIVFAWGANKNAQHIASEVIEHYPDTYCLAINKNGSPKHPLFCRDDTKLIPFQQ